MTTQPATNSTSAATGKQDLQVPASTSAAALQPVHSSAPETIYLVIGEDCPTDARWDQLEEVTWCEDDIDGNGLAYVRADRLATLTSELAIISEKRQLEADRCDVLVGELAELRAAERSLFDSYARIFRLVGATTPADLKPSTLHAHVEEAVATAARERDEARSIALEWLKQNGPGGWIDNLRAELASMTRERDEARAERDIEASARSTLRAELAALKTSASQVVTLRNSLGWCREVDDAIQALGEDASTQAPRVPAGWKLVPVEATDEMVRDVEHTARLGGIWSAASIYRAMIAAAPIPVDDSVDTPAEKAGPQPLTETRIQALNREAQDQGVSGIEPSIYLARAIERAHGVGAVAQKEKTE